MFKWPFNNPSSKIGVSGSETANADGSSRSVPSIDTASSSTSSDTAFQSEPTSSASSPVLVGQEGSFNEVSSILPDSKPISLSVSPTVVGEENSVLASKELNFKAGEENAENEQIGDRCMFVDRVSKSQPVQRAIGVYDYAKSYKLIGWALCAAEKAAELASVPATVVVKPISSICSTPVACADKVLCKGLDVVETIFPSIAAPSSEVAETKERPQGA